METKIKEQRLKIEHLEKALERLKDRKQLTLPPSKSGEHQREYLVEVRYLENLLRLEKEKLEGLTDDKSLVPVRELKDVTGNLDFVGKVPKSPRN